MFPHVLQPLHIFEPRYCDMLEAALKTDRLITMATLADGWEAEYVGRPRIETPVCVGRILMHTKAEDGHNILLLGLKRALIREELSTSETYRSAQVDLLPDFYPPNGDQERNKLKLELLERFQQFIADVPLVRENLRQLADGLLPLGPVTDLASFASPLAVADKLQLLLEADVDLRAQKLIEFLSLAAAKSSSQDAPPFSKTTGQFPPPFSLN